MGNKHRRIGFISYDEEPETIPLTRIQTGGTEEEEQQPTDEQPPLLNDYIPGAIYDGQGNIVTEESFRANLKKVKAEARNLNWSALARLVLYSGLGISILMLSYGAYKKYFQTPKNPVETIIKSKTERER